MTKKYFIILLTVVFTFSGINFYGFIDGIHKVDAQTISTKKLTNNSEKVIDQYFNQVALEEQSRLKINKFEIPSWIKKATKFAKDALKEGIDFLFLDDIKTIFSPNSSKTEIALAVLMLFPAGKVLKGGKVADLLIKSGKGSLVKAYAGLGKKLAFNSKGILFEGTTSKGWQHIKKGHITGQIAKKGDTLFPKHLSESQIKKIIMTSLKKGTYKGKTKIGDKSYEYTLNKYGIKKMKLVVDKDNIIKTAYPISGTSVRKVK